MASVAVAAERRALTRSLAALALVALAGCGAAAPRDNPLPEAALAGADRHGFVVWESNRSGSWRIWRAGLGGGDPEQLSPDEDGRRHCCAHIAPDGERLVYLSLPSGRQRYFDGDSIGPLRWLATDGSEGGTLAESARTYFEHRAAVWLDERTVSFIDEDGAVRTVDLDGGSRRTLLESAADGRRWLVDPQGRWAASGLAVLAPVEEGGRLGEAVPLPGCQPYFTSDGRWAFWTAGAGGPIDRFDLVDGSAQTLVEKSDPRLPDDRGYLYFPMVSADRTLLAMAASDGTHDHFQADYELRVAEIDTDTLELLGRARAIAPHPAVDRFPDLWRAPLALGRRTGQAPLDVEFAAPETVEWVVEKTLEDGEAPVELLRESGEELRTTLIEPGHYLVTAGGPERSWTGVAVVTRTEPPEPLNAGWPSSRRGLLWSWDPASGSTTQLEGEARRRPDGTLDLSAGSMLALKSADRLHAGMWRTNRFTLEVAAEGRSGDGRSWPDGAILSIGRDAGSENVMLGVESGRLVLRMRVGPKREPFAQVDLGPAPTGSAHLTVTYTPGRLALYRDGRLALETTELLGHFFHWRPYPLSLGDRWRGGAAWSGSLSRVAVFDRMLPPEEIAGNARRAGFGG